MGHDESGLVRLRTVIHAMVGLVKCLATQAVDLRHVAGPPPKLAWFRPTK